MAVQIIECEQGSPEWLKARLGLPTASNFATIVAKGDGAGRKTLMRTLAGEIITGKPTDGYKSDDMARGNDWEATVREKYALLHDVDIQLVGFVRNGRAGASPDGLIGANGGAEFKTTMPNYLIEMILKDEFPTKHFAQCQGNIWVCDREWWDVSVFWPDMPTFTKRTYRDDAYVRSLQVGVDMFNAELDAMVDKIRRYGGIETPIAAAA